ncbi:MAG: hypothetical protein HOV94_06245, partial [Saccharothrix sp.]|nr:hypothetical protein [Saccharothrix sp.]
MTRTWRERCRHLTGRHRLVTTTAGTVGGYAVWHTACSCGGQWRGVETSLRAARDRAAQLRGPRDQMRW